MRYIQIITIVAAIVAASCTNREKNTEKEIDYDSLTAEEMLAVMRADTSWTRELDSMAQIAIGPGAKCIDPVWHLFSYDGRFWLFGQDWGGVLEIPEGYIPEDDYTQTHLSFHGTSANSPDSLIRISFYEGFQAFEYDEFIENTCSGLLKDYFTIDDKTIKDSILTIRAHNDFGINYYGKYMYKDSCSVEHIAVVQYPDNRKEEGEAIIPMVNRYPAGPNGKIYVGWAIQ